jgi:hypothetical protein
MPQFKVTIEGRITYTVLVDAESEEDVYTESIYDLLDQDIISEDLNADVTEVESA